MTVWRSGAAPGNTGSTTSTSVTRWPTRCEVTCRPTPKPATSGSWRSVRPRDGQLLEILVLDPFTEDATVIHAMPAREKFTRGDHYDPNP